VSELESVLTLIIVKKIYCLLFCGHSAEEQPFNKARKNGVAVALAGLYANDLHIISDRLRHQHIITQF